MWYSKDTKGFYEANPKIKGAVEVDHSEYLRLINAGLPIEPDSDGVPQLGEMPAPSPLSIRDQKQQAYTAELSPEGTFEKTVGDCLDALFKAVKGDMTDVDALIPKIASIKARLQE